MSARSLKAFKTIFLEGNFHRLWQILNKSPMIHVSGFLHGFVRPKPLKLRKSLQSQIQLSGLEKSLVDELKTKGYVRVDSLFTTADFAPLQGYLTEKLQALEEAKSKQRVHTKDFWVRLSDLDLAEGVTDGHPLAALSLKESLLKVIAGYLGSAPFLEYFLLTYSLPSAQPLKSSQLWHQDHDNHRMVKFFVYLSDVEKEEDGPFTLLSKEATPLIRNSFFPRHLSDGEVNPYYRIDQAVQIKGKKFSAFLVDTSVCYHMGSRVAEGHSRLMSTSLYVTLPKAYWNKLKSFVRLSSKMSPLQEAAADPSFGLGS